VISAIVTDPNGVGDLAGGVLKDPVSGTTYGVFGTPGGQGTFSYILTWSQIDQVRPIGNLPPGGTTRDVLAIFYDNGNLTAQQSLTLTLSCSGGLAVCGGACVDLKSSPSDCGSCGTPAPRLA
jgi:hypothetical protein